MKVVKSYKRRYDIQPPVFKWSMSVGDYINRRKQHGRKTGEFEKCFVCGCSFEKDFMPNLAWVTGKGNMFVCDECANKIESTHPTEKGGGEG